MRKYADIEIIIKEKIVRFLTDNDKLFELCDDTTQELAIDHLILLCQELREDIRIYKESKDFSEFAKKLKEREDKWNI